MNDFKVISLKRKDLQKVMESYDTNSEYVHFAVEIDSVEGDQVLWVENGKFGDCRDYIIINKPYFPTKYV